MKKIKQLSIICALTLTLICSTCVSVNAMPMGPCNPQPQPQPQYENQNRNPQPCTPTPAPTPIVEEEPEEEIVEEEPETINYTESYTSDFDIYTLKVGESISDVSQSEPNSKFNKISYNEGYTITFDTTGSIPVAKYTAEDGTTLYATVTIDNTEALNNAIAAVYGDGNYNVTWIRVIKENSDFHLDGQVSLIEEELPVEPEEEVTPTEPIEEEEVVIPTEEEEITPTEPENEEELIPAESEEVIVPTEDDTKDNETIIPSEDEQNNTENKEETKQSINNTPVAIYTPIYNPIVPIIDNNEDSTFKEIVSIDEEEVAAAGSVEENEPEQIAEVVEQHNAIAEDIPQQIIEVEDEETPASAIIESTIEEKDEVSCFIHIIMIIAIIAFIMLILFFIIDKEKNNIKVRILRIASTILAIIVAFGLLFRGCSLELPLFILGICLSVFGIVFSKYFKEKEEA